MKKKSLSDLAFFGGQPEFAEMLHVGRPNFGDRDRFLTRVGDMLDRRWLTNRGPFLVELEQRLADFLGMKHFIAMNNGTIALEIVIRALGLKGEVIVPSFTFIATPHALQWQEITPVFCDVDPSTHNLDPDQVERMITPKTTGIIAVHVWGRPCLVEALTDIANRRGLKLVFDAAHAFGCTYHGKMIGNFGDAEVFSFHATKFFNTFEGGGVATNDDALANRLRLMQNFGFSGLDNVVYIGTNGKMSEDSAAMGLTNFESLGEFIQVNKRNYQTYRQALHGVPGIELLQYDETERNNFQYIVLEVDEEVTGISRDLLVDLLHAENVRARRYFFPGCHQMEPYRSYFPHAGLLLPHTEQLVTRVLSLPTGTTVSPEDVGRICQIIRIAVEHAVEITAKMAAQR